MLASPECTLRREFNNHPRPLDTIISRAVLTRFVRRWSAPRKPGLVETRADLGYTFRLIRIIDDPCPFGDQAGQHFLLLRGHLGPFQPLGNDWSARHGLVRVRGRRRGN